jgi:hypothetical protein
MTGCFWRDKCAMRCFRFLGGKSHKTLTGFPMFTPAVTDAEKLARYEEYGEEQSRGAGD